MRNILLITLLIVGCLTFAQEAKAQAVYGDAWMEYDAVTNQMRAVTWSQPDYAVQAYYCAEVFAYVYQNDNGIGQLWDDNFQPDYGQCSGMAYAEAFFPYDPNAEYIIETLNSVKPITRWDEDFSYYNDLL